MKPGRGKRVAVGAGVLGLLVLIATGFALKDRIREEWYICRLSAQAEDARARAARALGKMRSQRAVPQLARLVAQVLSSKVAESVEGKESLGCLKELPPSWAKGNARSVAQYNVSAVLDQDAFLEAIFSAFVRDGRRCQYPPPAEVISRYWLHVVIDGDGLAAWVRHLTGSDADWSQGNRIYFANEKLEVDAPGWLHERVNWVVKALNLDPSVRDAVEARMAVMRIGEPAATLLQWLSKDRDLSVRTAAAILLHDLDHPVQQEDLEK